MGIEVIARADRRPLRRKQRQWTNGKDAAERQYPEVGNLLVQQGERRSEQSRYNRPSCDWPACMMPFVPGQQRAPDYDRQNRRYHRIGEPRIVRKQRLEYGRHAKRLADDEAGHGEYRERRRNQADPRIVAVPAGNEFMHRHGAVVPPRGAAGQEFQYRPAQGINQRQAQSDESRVDNRLPEVAACAPCKQRPESCKSDGVSDRGVLYDFRNHVTG